MATRQRNGKTKQVHLQTNSKVWVGGISASCEQPHPEEEAHYSASPGPPGFLLTPGLRETIEAFPSPATEMYTSLPGVTSPVPGGLSETSGTR